MLFARDNERPHSPWHSFWCSDQDSDRVKADCGFKFLCRSCAVVPVFRFLDRASFKHCLFASRRLMLCPLYLTKEFLFFFEECLDGFSDSIIVSKLVYRAKITICNHFNPHLCVFKIAKKGVFIQVSRFFTSGALINNALPASCFTRARWATSKSDLADHKRYSASLLVASGTFTIPLWRTRYVQTVKDVSSRLGSSSNISQTIARLSRCVVS